MPRPSRRLHVLAALGVATLCALPAHAMTTGGRETTRHTSFTLRTTAAGIDVPVAGVRGGWDEWHHGDRARFFLKGETATGTTTTASARWRSNCLPVRDVSGFTVSSIDAHRQYAPTTSDGSSDVTIRYSDCRHTWASLHVHRRYAKNDPDLLEYSVTGVDLKTILMGSHGRVQFQVTVDDVVTDTSGTDHSLTVAVDRG